MSRRMRTYFYAVLGAIGGLIGWQVSDTLGLSFSSNLYFSEAVVGALVGLVHWFVHRHHRRLDDAQCCPGCEIGADQRPARTGGGRHRPAAERVFLSNHRRRRLLGVPWAGVCSEC